MLSKQVYYLYSYISSPFACIFFYILHFFQDWFQTTIFLPLPLEWLRLQVFATVLSPSKDFFNKQSKAF
jgi:hypothetical protein